MADEHNDCFASEAAFEVEIDRLVKEEDLTSNKIWVIFRGPSSNKNTANDDTATTKPETELIVTDVRRKDTRVALKKMKVQHAESGVRSPPKDWMVKILSKILPTQHPKIKVFCGSNDDPCEFTDVDAVQIAEALKKNVVLERFDLTAAKFPPGGWKTIASALGESPNLRELKIDCIRTDNEEVDAVAEMAVAKGIRFLRTRQFVPS